MSRPITITLRQIEAHGPCEEGWEAILAADHLHGGDFDKPFSMAEGLDVVGLENTLWALRCLPERSNLWRKFAVWCARQVQHLMTDERSIKALDVAWRHSEGLATDEELNAARDAAWAARNAAQAAARDAAWAAAWAAAGAAAGAAWAAWAARDAARAAARAAQAAARDAAWDAARDAQAKKLRQILEAREWVGETA